MSNYLIYLIGILVILILLKHSNIYQIEGLINIKPLKEKVTYVRPSCNTKISKTTGDIIDELDINSTKNKENKENVLILPCSYNRIDEELRKIEGNVTDQRIFLIDNGNQLSNKQDLWRNLVRKYGRDGAKELAPATYVLANEDDRKHFMNEYKQGDMYILKKNIQRQQGLLITNDKNKILSDKVRSEYVVGQYLLQDPYIIAKRKTNMRFYLLIVCRGDEKDGWVYSDGFMYYTKVPFKKGSTEFDPNITTGYIDREVYVKNPLTHKDFKEYLDMDRKLSQYEQKVKDKGIRISDYVFANIHNTIRLVTEAMFDVVCTTDRLKKSITFQLFGVDIAVDDKLRAKIIEINKGPDLGGKDGRDSNLKHNVVRSMFEILKLNNKPVKKLDIMDKDSDGEFILLTSR